MKKLKILIAIVCITLISVASLAGCDLKPTILDNFTMSFSDAYDYAAMSAVGVMDSFNNNSLTQDALALSGNLEVSGTENNNNKLEEEIISEELKQSILDNIQLVNNTISGGVIKSEVTNSDREEYQYTYSITATNEIGETSNYVFYYNELANIEEEEEEEDDEEVKDNSEEELEQEIHLQGIVILNEIEYQMLGDKEIEEGEVEVCFKILLDENNYVIVEQEMEDEEQEFKYMVFENGKKVLDTNIEYEYDEESKEMEVVFKTKTPEEQAMYKYTIFEDENGSYIGVRIKTNTSHIKALIEVKVNELGNKEYEIIKITEDNKGKDKDLKEEYKNVSEYEEDD